MARNSRKHANKASVSRRPRKEIDLNDYRIVGDPTLTLDGVAVPNAPRQHSFAAQVVQTVQDRGGTYGHPSDNHQLTADLLSAWLSRRLGVEVKVSPEDVCMINVLQKCSRLAFVTKDDSWLDVAGFTENVGMLKPEQRNWFRSSDKGDPK